jgi:hypothetical protein
VFSVVTCGDPRAVAGVVGALRYAGGVATADPRGFGGVDVGPRFRTVAADVDARVVKRCADDAERFANDGNAVSTVVFARDAHAVLDRVTAAFDALAARDGATNATAFAQTTARDAVKRADAAVARVNETKTG